MSVRDEILKLVDESRAGLAYSRLMSVPEFQGRCSLSHAKYPMVRYWEGLSESAAEAILQLAQEGAIRHEPTDTLAYVAHGHTLDLPVFSTEQISKAKDLSQPHWMPVLLIRAERT